MKDSCRLSCGFCTESVVLPTPPPKAPSQPVPSPEAISPFRGCETWSYIKWVNKRCVDRPYGLFILCACELNGAGAFPAVFLKRERERDKYIQAFCRYKTGAIVRISKAGSLRSCFSACLKNLRCNSFQWRRSKW